MADVECSHNIKPDPGKIEQEYGQRIKSLGGPYPRYWCFGPISRLFIAKITAKSQEIKKIISLISGRTPPSPLKPRTNRPQCSESQSPLIHFHRPYFRGPHLLFLPDSVPFVWNRPNIGWRRFRSFFYRLPLAPITCYFARPSPFSYVIAHSSP